jgi:hypothetical protein
MDRQSVAGNMLLCGLTRGRQHVLDVFGREVNSLIFMTFADLHKNNTPEEAFVFVMIRLFNKKYASVDASYEFDNYLKSESILDYIKATAEYREDSRMSQFKDTALAAVLDDFIYILSKQLFYQQDIFDKVKAKLSSL